VTEGRARTLSRISICHL